MFVNFQPLKYVIKRFILRRDSLIAVAPQHGFRLHVKTEDVVGRHLYKYGVHEAEATDFLRRFLKFRDGDVIFDIGANVGWYSLVLDRIAAASDVDIFAFEPEPTNFKLLRENVTHNSANHVSTEQCAVADTSGHQTLHLYNKSNRGRHSLLAIHDGDTLDVSAVTLDEFWESRGLEDRVPHFIKMDIEGFELMALRGAAKVLSRCPLVMLEYSPAYMKAASLAPADLIDLMLNHGFAAHQIENGALAAVDVGALRDNDCQVDLFWKRP